MAFDLLLPCAGLLDQGGVFKYPTPQQAGTGFVTLFPGRGLTVDS